MITVVKYDFVIWVQQNRPETSVREPGQASQQDIVNKQQYGKIERPGPLAFLHCADDGVDRLNGIPSFSLSTYAGQNWPRSTDRRTILARIYRRMSVDYFCLPNSFCVK